MTTPIQRDYRGKPRRDFQVKDFGPSTTVQSSMAECDLKQIIERFKATGTVSALNRAQLEYRDVTGFTDFADVHRATDEAKETFMKLPSKVREQFNHSVYEFLDAAHDPEKRDALVVAGFIEAPLDASEAVDPGSDLGDPPEGGPPAEPVLPS